MAVALAASPAWSQETLKLTIAAAHPEVFLWVKHFKKSFIPALDAELAKTGKIKIEWTEGYGGTIVKNGSEAEAFEQGIIDVGLMGGVFNPAKWGVLNMSYAMPFGETDAGIVAAAANKAIEQTPGLLDQLAETTGAVYIGGGFAIDSYQIGSTKPLSKLADLNGIKLGGAGPNLTWLAGTGAVGVQGSFVTFYNDIKTGVYDGYVGFFTAAVQGKLYEVAPYWNEANFGAMYVGGVGVSKMRWDTFSDETKAAFRVAAEAYAKGYTEEQTALLKSARESYVANGGQFIAFDPAERAAWIKALPNPVDPWLKAAEARGEPGRQVLEAYRDNLKAAGFTFVRDYLAQ
jgi:TRAP-type C4-dicarboxylate transport system substrate-binding protein